VASRWRGVYNGLEVASVVADFQDLLKLLRDRPEWREELRRVLLTDDLLALPSAVQRLAETVQHVAELQAKTQRQLDGLERWFAQLSQAQARTEEAVAQLAQAQARTEERVGRLEEAVAQLAQAQARTEQAVQQLAQQVGRLSDAVGFTLEELARELAPAYLAERYGIRVARLERRFLTVDGEEVELDFFGEGTRDGEEVVVLGEVRSRIYGRDVEALARRARSLAPQLRGVPIPALFGFVIHPSASEAAARTGVLVIAAVRP